MTLPSPIPQVPGLPARRRYTDDDNIHIRPLTEDELQEWLEDLSDLQDTIDLWDKLSGIPGLLDTRPLVEVKQQHYGPGPHPGTGTSQDVHAGGSARVLGSLKVGVTLGKIENDPDNYSRDFEVINVVDENGKMIFEKAGRRHTVQMTEDDVILMKDKIVTHNHPEVGYPISPDDLSLAIYADLKEVRAYNSEKIYIFTRPPDGWGLTLSRSPKIFHKIRKTNRFGDREIPIDQLEDFRNEAWARFANLIGASYRVEVR